jgi:hypothetical protein
MPLSSDIQTGPDFDFWFDYEYGKVEISSQLVPDHDDPKSVFLKLSYPQLAEELAAHLKKEFPTASRGCGTLTTTDDGEGYDMEGWYY